MLRWNQRGLIHRLAHAVERQRRQSRAKAAAGAVFSASAIAFDTHRSCTQRTYKLQQIVDLVYTVEIERRD